MPHWMRRFLWQDGGDAGSAGGGAADSAAGAADSAAPSGGGGVDASDVDALVEHAAQLAGPAPADDGALKPQRTPRAQRGTGGRFAKPAADGEPGRPPAAAAAADGQPPAAAPPAGPAGAAAPTYEALQRFGVELPADVPPQVAAQVDAAVGRWFTERYEPAARQVVQDHRDVAAYRDELEAFTQSEPYQLAAQLAGDPQLLASVQQYLNGGGAGPAAAGQTPAALAGIDPSQLDETGQALYASVAQSQREVQALRAQLHETTQAQREMRDWIAMRDQADASAHQEHVQSETARGLKSAIDEASRQFGFDVRAYKPQFKEALGYATQTVEAAMWRWQQAGGKGPRPVFDTAQLLREGFKRAGFEQLQQQRKRQADTSAGPPGGRAPRGVGRGASLEELVDFGVEAAEQYDAAR